MTIHQVNVGNYFRLSKYQLISKLILSVTVIQYSIVQGSQRKSLNMEGLIKHRSVCTKEFMWNLHPPEKKVFVCISDILCIIFDNLASKSFDASYLM